MTKTCTKCGEVYEANEEFFIPNKLGRFGLSAERRACLKKRYEKYRSEHPEYRERAVRKSREYYQSHPEWAKEVKHRHYLNHREQVKQKSREYREAHPLYWKLNTEQYSAKDARRRSRKMQAEGVFTSQDVLDKLEDQQGKCFYCKCDLSAGYHADHYIPLARGGTNWPSNIVITCPMCNLQKRDMLPEDFIREYIE